ncbi:translation initiation factor IF-3, mitochondrial isoform X2 [Lampris incognitus]|nr:translation initiation factor IF-3, mitochondrial isoform X2 [Lampris incognitus]
MSAGCLRWMLRHAVCSIYGGIPANWTPASRFLVGTVRSKNITTSWRLSLFSTAVDDTQDGPAPPRKKQNPRAHASIGSIGRKIHQRHLQLISETGENLGTMHRSDVLRLMDEKGLKLVLLSERADPPVYRLMSGKQIHEEQLKLREKEKTKAAPVQVKELTFSSDITTHDLSTKLKQVQTWLSKKHHVRITLRSGRVEPKVSLDTTLEQMVQQIEVMVGFISKPKAVRDGKAAVCVLRPPSAKELSQKGQNKSSAAQATNSSPQTTQPSASPDKTQEAQCSHLFGQNVT